MKSSAYHASPENFWQSSNVNLWVISHDYILFVKRIFYITQKVYESLCIKSSCCCNDTMNLLCRKSDHESSLKSPWHQLSVPSLSSWSPPVMFTRMSKKFKTHHNTRPLFHEDSAPSECSALLPSSFWFAVLLLKDESYLLSWKTSAYYYS